MNDPHQLELWDNVSASTPTFKNNANQIWLARQKGELRNDGIYNEVTGFGVGAFDKTIYSSYGNFNSIGDVELSLMYHGNAMAARVVDAWPDEAFREKYYSVTGNIKVDNWLDNSHKRLNVRSNFLQAMKWGRCFGGAALLLGIDDGLPTWMPVNPGKIKSLKYLYPVDRRYLTPTNWYDNPESGKLGKPSVYLVTPDSSQTSYMSMRVHESRMIIFGGAETARQESQMLNYWDFSVLQRAYEALIQFDTAWQALTLLMTDANQAVFSMSGLAEAIAHPNGDIIIRERMREINKYRSLMRAMIIDAGSDDEKPESFERQSVSFSDIPQTLDRINARLSGAAGVPVTIFFGTSPGGLNATGESDFRGFYDKMDTYRINDVAPKLTYLNQILLAAKESPYHFRDIEKLDIEFDPLWSLDDLQKSQKAQADAATYSSLVQSAILLTDEAALQMNNDGMIKLSDEAIKYRQERLQITYNPVDIVEEDETDEAEQEELELPSEEDLQIGG